MSLTSYVSFPTSTRLPSVIRSLPILLFLGDIFGLFICVEIALWLRLGEPLNKFDPFVWGFVLLVLVELYLVDAYHPDRQIAGLRTPARILIGSIGISIFASALIYLFGAWGNYTVAGRGILLPSLTIFTIWAIISRIYARKWMRLQAQQSRWLMLGAGESGITFAQHLLELNPLGRLFVLTQTDQDTTDLAQKNLNCVGNITDLSTWISQSWSAVIVANQIELSEIQLQQLMQIRLRGIPVYKLPDFYESLWYKLPSSLLQDQWLAFSAGFHLMPGYFNIKLKRFADVLIAGLLLVLLSPLMLVTALAIKLDSPGPVFYSQLRSGLYGKPFKVYKFRSMYQDAEKRGAQWASQRDPRITRVGYWLRVIRIDELPQIWNVLCSEMSLIGPRPERPEFDVKLKEAIPYYEVRYLVKPGITGWAQVMYPYGASIEDAYEKLAYDLYYIKNYSLWLDIAIAFKTIRVVLLGKGR
ncbi:exopolysaccharide biosynthesis polyprenyl glycosylphosphotransferase [Scytonema sp. UIC 10036]|uniref:sugar transferase n=1 Tax=Scytonema sp. UIC 10036 TaxID=2304196 RepID=UPI0012DA3932|nr:sugar transferase [Scytonema sp. UIC 10036]MUG98983.1 exopolysaccharide biosynthesis polyprenyl glycosylphosphotransferase [Scytonema sp. UIC 10036]